MNGRSSKSPSGPLRGSLSYPPAGHLLLKDDDDDDLDQGAMGQSHNRYIAGGMLRQLSMYGAAKDRKGLGQVGTRRCAETPSFTSWICLARKQYQSMYPRLIMNPVLISSIKDQIYTPM